MNAFHKNIIRGWDFVFFSVGLKRLNEVGIKYRLSVLVFPTGHD